MGIATNVRSGISGSYKIFAVLPHATRAGNHVPHADEILSCWGRRQPFLCLVGGREVTSEKEKGIMGFKE